MEDHRFGRSDHPLRRRAPAERIERGRGRRGSCAVAVLSCAAIVLGALAAVFVVLGGTA